MAQPIGQLVVHSSKPRRPADLVPTQFSGADELLSGGEVMVDVIARGCQSSSSQLAMRQAAGLRKTAPDAWSFEGAMCYRVGAGALVPDCEPKVLHYSLGKLPAGKYVVRSGTLSASFEVPSLLEHGAVSAGDYMH